MAVREAPVRIPEPIEPATCTDSRLRTLLVRVMGGVALSGLSLILWLLAGPPSALWPLAFVALIPMLVAQHRVLPRPLAGLAMAVTIGGSIAVGGSQQFERIPSAVGLAAIAAAGALLGLGFLDRLAQERSAYRFFPVTVPLIWVGLDVFSGHSSLPSTWGYQAYSLYAHPLAIQPVAALSTNALNLLILVSNFALAGLMVGPARPRRRGWPAGLVVGWGAWLLAGALMLGQAPAVVGVAAVQMAPRWASYVPGATLASQPETAEMASYAQRAAAQGAQLVVYHEDQIPFPPGPVEGGPFTEVARAAHTYLVIGYRQPGRNEAVTISPTGALLGVYGKQHPVAFLGEQSVPTPVRVYRTSFGPLATIICYDLDFLDTSRQAALRGARIVAVPSQDWGRVARVHYTHLVFRAVENHLTMIKADGGYDSTIVDPYGRILARSITPAGADRLLVRRVPLGSGRTLGQHVEPWFAPVALILGLGIVLFALLRPEERFSEEGRAGT